MRMLVIAFLPILIAFVVPRAYMTALFLASGVILVASIGMLVVQERRKRRRG